MNETKVEELLYLLVFDWSLEVNDDLGIKNRLHVLECGPGALPGSVAFFNLGLWRNNSELHAVEF